MGKLVFIIIFSFIFYSCEEDKEMQVLFSGTYGEKCTYRITDKDVESFGKDAGKYIDLDNLISMS